VVVLNNPQNPIEQLTKVLIELQLSENEWKKVQIDLENIKHTLENKEKQLQSTQQNVDQISNKY